MYPNAPAAEFVRFLQLVEEGYPFAGPMMTVGWEGEVPLEYQTALAVRQRLDLERSIRWCRKVSSI